MKEVVFNEYFLKDSEIDKKSRKVRALIVDNEGNIRITKCGDIFILPGGKIENGETSFLALKRELREELGCSLVGLVYPFLKTKHYLKDYPDLYKNTVKNKVTETTYYYIHEDNLIKNRCTSLDSLELRGNFESFSIHKDEVKLLLNYTGNPRKDYFNKELYLSLYCFDDLNISKNHIKLKNNA